jgi:hypothetical protein
MRTFAMTAATPPGASRPRLFEPESQTVVLAESVVDEDAAPTVIGRAAETVLAQGRTLARDSRSARMSRADLLTAVKNYRDERGRMQDMAAHLLLTEVACHLEWNVAAVRVELAERARGLRDDPGRGPDPILAVLLSEVVAALGSDPNAAGGFCEFCGTAGGGCAVCQSE